MFIAMNSFQVKADQADAFVQVWRERESFLSEFSGFVGFQLLRSKPSEPTEGSELPSSVTFVSHSTWLNESDFLEWVNSDHMKKAHSGKSKTTGMVLGPPRFQGFEVMMNQVAGDRRDYRSTHQDIVVEKNFVRESKEQIALREWAQEKNFPAIRIGAFEGQLLETLLRANGAKKGVEVGTLGGYSASWILRALPEDGELHSLELEADRAALVTEKFKELGWDNRATIHAGDARDLLTGPLSDLKDLDFVFIDADKASYAQYAEWAIPRLRKGGLLLADNAYIWGGMEYFPNDPETLPELAHKSQKTFTNNQYAGMRRCWKLLSEHPELSSIILPTGEGLGVAVKR